jgi:anti-sigma factor RsiW
VIGRRRHDPERDAAIYVSGEMRRRERARFEAHLLGCEDCWHEVSLGRQGRGLAEASREVAPPGLRDQTRAALSIAPRPSRWLPLRLALAAAAVALVAFSILSVVEIWDRREPPAIAAAVAAVRTETLASRGPAQHEPPDLASQGLRLVMGERVDLAGLPSDAFMYRNTVGDALFLFVSGSRFPMARGATAHTVGGIGWLARSDGMTLVCGDRPMHYLVIAENPSLIGPVEHVLTMTEPASAQ